MGLGLSLIPPGTWAHIYNPNAPVVRQKEEAGDPQSSWVN